MKFQKHFEKSESPNDFQKELEADLERLKQTLKLSYELKVFLGLATNLQQIPAGQFSRYNIT